VDTHLSAFATTIKMIPFAHRHGADSLATEIMVHKIAPVILTLHSPQASAAFFVFALRCSRLVERAAKMAYPGIAFLWSILL
jgi:hypothetical protein